LTESPAEKDARPVGVLVIVIIIIIIIIIMLCLKHLWGYVIPRVTCVQLRLITILGNCGCVAVASFLGVPSP
jgi:hypothetical protein